MNPESSGESRVRRVGPYLLEDRLGSGGMGTVWRAWDERLRRPVAIKQVLPADLSVPRRHHGGHREPRLPSPAAAMDLARLWHREGWGELARNLLAAVVERFTEGWETADLKAARALLRELGAA